MAILASSGRQYSHTVSIALRTTAAFAILEQLAADQRRVLSDWRALLLLRRATFALAPTERRWTELPDAPSDLHPLFRQMTQRGELSPIGGFQHLYAVTVPYARLGHVEEEEVLLEANPYAALSHLTALVFHRLTDELPKSMTAMAPAVGTGDQLPLDTEPRDWSGLPLPGGRTPARVLGRPLTWTRPKADRFFGVGVYQPRGYSLRVTTPERTLIDGLMTPELSGGMTNVLHAWTRARDTLDLDTLVSSVDRFDVKVLRQRAGFVLEELGLKHPLMEQWRERAQRGGSSKLVGSAPYASAFNERWNLSLNAPVTALTDSPA